MKKFLHFVLNKIFNFQIWGISLLHKDDHGVGRKKTTNMHHFYICIFNTRIDWQLKKFEDHFYEASTKLFLYVTCFDSSNEFCRF